LLACSCGKETRGAGGQEARELGVKPLYEGSLEAPLLGLVLAEPVSVLLHDPPAPGSSQVQWERVEANHFVTLSRDWTRILRFSLGPESTSAYFRSVEEPTQLPGLARFALDSTGATTVAWLTPGEDSGRASLWIGDQQGEQVEKVDVPGLLWVDVSNDGRRLAYGTSAESVVLTRKAERLDHAAAGIFGALSARGAWLAVERELDEGDEAHVLTLMRLDPPLSKDIPVTGDGLQLVFDPGEGRLARVSSRSVQTIWLGGAEPAVERELQAPEGSDWRSAAFEENGRLALGRIQVSQRPKRFPKEEALPDLPGKARFFVEVFEPGATAAGARGSGDVALWNGRSPEVAFAGNGRLFAVVWPSAFEVVLP
jgi:hypothetical protein